MSAPRSGRAVAEARTNIALVKYWGKRDGRLNLPAVGSLSLTLDGLATRTETRFDPALTHDRLILNGAVAEGEPLDRVSSFLDVVRARAGRAERAEVVSANNFPTASGLASSASGFAALALAASRALGLKLEPRELSLLARRGSGSAARSIFGGLVLLPRGQRPDGEDCFAVPLEAGDWPLRLVVATTPAGRKQVLSRDGMRATAETSPYYSAWLAQSEPDLEAARRAVAERDLERLGDVAERSCLAMHASAMAARPGIIYFSGVTIEGYHAVRALRRAGVPAWFTCDAGPHVKALTDAAHADKVAARLAEVPGMVRTLICVPGRGAEVVE